MTVAPHWGEPRRRVPQLIVESDVDVGDVHRLAARRESRAGETHDELARSVNAVDDLLARRAARTSEEPLR